MVFVFSIKLAQDRRPLVNQFPNKIETGTAAFNDIVKRIPLRSQSKNPDGDCLLYVKTKARHVPSPVNIPVLDSILRQSPRGNHEVDEMCAKMVLFQNVSLLLRTKIVSRAGYGLRPYRHVEDTCGPVGSYIADPRGARELYDPLTVPKTCIKLWDNT